MSLPLPDDRAEPQLAAEYDAAREREGRVMAILRALGPRPEIVRAFLTMADAALYGPAALDRREREVLAHAASEANGAQYSATIHAQLARDLGEPGPRDPALTAFARRLTLRPREADQAVADLRDHLTDPEVYDAIAVVGLLNLANRAALATGITAADDLP
jgi:AhpD family alkylhydroperoxidase